MSKEGTPVIDEAGTAKLLLKLKSSLEDFGSVRDQVKQLATVVDGIKGLDLDKVVTEFERLKASHESIADAIAARRDDPLYVTGIEDYGRGARKRGRPQFSILKAVVGMKRGGSKEAFEDIDAGFEYELLRQTQEKVRAQKGTNDLFAKAQQAGDHSLGGAFIPDQVIPDVIEEVFTRSQFVGLEESGETRVSVLDGLTGGTVRVPKFEGGVVAFWQGEGDSAIESMASVGDLTMTPKKITAFVRLTEEMKQFMSYGFENRLRRSMVRALAKKIDYTIAFGTGGSNAPRGIVHTPGVRVYSAQSGAAGVNGDALGSSPFQADWAGAKIDFDVLDNMLLALEEDDIDLDETQSWVSSPRTFRYLKQLKVTSFSGQTTERSYLIGAPMITNDRLAELIGPFGGTTQIPSNDVPGAQINAPTTATAQKFSTIIGGNLGEGLFGRWTGIVVLSDEGRGAEFAEGIERVRMRMHADFQVAQERALIYCPDIQVRN